MRLPLLAAATVAACASAFASPAYTSAESLIQRATGDAVAVTHPLGDVRSELAADGTLRLQKGENRADIRFESLARGEEVVAVAPARGIASRAHRNGRSAYDLRRDGVEEWFEKGPDGLRQWIRVPKRPGSPASLSPLVANLEVSGLTPFLVDADRVDLADETKSVFRYKGIRAWDATGKTLPARLETRGSRIRLVVEDQDAAYPVTIDPAWTLFTYLESPYAATDASFGFSVAASQAFAVIGEPSRKVGTLEGAGAVYFTNNFGISQVVMAPEPSLGGNFGYSVAMYGNFAAVSQPFDSTGGKVYIYEFSPFSFSWEYRTTVSGDEIYYASFGMSLAMTEDYLVVGAPYAYADGHFGAGRIYGFKRNGSSWDLDGTIDGTLDQGTLGYSVDVAPAQTPGTYWIAASESPEIGYIIGPEKVYTILVGPGMAVSDVNLLTPPVADTNGSFGEKLSIDGTNLLVGAPRSIVGGQYEVGTVFAYRRSGTDWIHTQTIDNPSAQSGRRFGAGLDIDNANDFAMIGASLATLIRPYDGAAYFYQLSGGQWLNRKRVGSFTGESSSWFGFAVAVSQGYAYVGSHRATTGAPNAGAVFGYLYSTLDVQPSPQYVTGGKPISITVTSDYPAPPGGMPVYLRSSGGVTLPGTATIPEGARSVTVQATTQPTTDDFGYLINASTDGSEFANTEGFVRSPRVGRIDLSRSAAASGETVTGTVVLNGAAPAGGTLVNLAYETPVAGDASVTVPAGQTRGTFSFVAPTVGAQATLTLSATPSFSPKTASLTVYPSPRPTLDLADSVASLGRRRSATVALSFPAPAAFDLALAYSGPVSGPATIPVSAGATSATFEYDTSSTATGVGTVTATTAAGLAASDRVNVVRATLLSATLSPKTVASGNASTLTLTLDRPAPAGGVVVLLSATKPFASFPATAVVPEGATSTTVPVIGNSAIARTIGIVAKVYLGGNRGDYLTINP